jgi:RNA polymerase sigma factor (sigma-70 family)
MATAQLGTVLWHLHKLAAPRAGGQGSDRQLLDAFAARRDEGAFATLVARHGPMVLRVCRRVLGHEHDAEDAFQATFLVLARHTASIRKREALANWLHGVAYRTAMKAKRSAARRRNHEARVPDRPTGPAPGPTWDEVQAVLDEEIQRLPPAFRAAFVLCVLEGKSGPQAAADLGVKEGTVWSRLTRARQQLQRRLTRRGIRLAAVLAALSVGAGAAPAGLSGTLAQATIRFGLLVAAGKSAAGTVPSHVAALAAGVTRAMWTSKLKLAGAMLLALGLIGVSGALGRHALAGKEQAPPPAAAATAGSQPKARTTKPPAGKAAAKPSETFVYRGRVLGPDGNPFAGAELYLVLPPGGKENPPAVRATTGADGRFEFTATRAEFVPAQAPADVDPFAHLQVVAVAKGHGPDWTALEGRPDGDLTFRLVKNDVNIEGRILDLQGKAIPGAKVHVLRLETTAQGDLEPFLKAWRSFRDGYLALGQLSKTLHHPILAGLPRTVNTDADGRFRLSGTGRERVVVLSVEAPGIEHATLRVLPRSPAEVKALAKRGAEGTMPKSDLPVLAVYGTTFEHLAIPARLIVGTVRDRETGKPMKGVRVSGSAVGSAGDTHREAYTDAHGRYQLQGLPKAEKYCLTAWPGDFSFYIPGGKEVSGGAGLANVQADFEMIRGVEVRGRVTDKVTGKPVTAGVTYVPLGDNRHPGAAFFRLVSKNCEGPRTGTFREMVPPGPGVFLVRVRAPGDDNRYTQVRLDPADKGKAGLDEWRLDGVNAYRVVEVPADAKSLTYDIQVDPGRSLTGTVLGPDGEPLAGAQVKGLTAVWMGKGTALKTATFTVGALDGHEPRQLLFVHVQRKLAGSLVVRGDEKEPVKAKLEPWGVLTGRILDEDGQPAAGARLHLSFPHRMFFQPATWWVSSQGEDVRTDRDGRFRAEGLTPGLEFRLSAASDRRGFLPLAGTPDGMRVLSVQAGETRDLGDLRARRE